ncbi:conjugal transfer protein TraH [Photobacterium piscicola]|uniref:conjugal transfer protein TraH n=1 Tax=Photobacterium piscicola TaxID=1378299 RepID=UPI002E192247|nr:conjugal transfer protein TraH [Photobacterium piscicola]
MKLLPLLIALTLSTPAVASIDGDLGQFFDGLNYNTTNPQAYKGQAANYYTGGSAFIRTPVRQAQIANVSLPSINAGCGGIDLFAGGFSYIDSDELVKMGKSIVSSAIPFAVDLALQTWAPQLKNVKDRLESIAQRINALSVNSCEAAQTSVAALSGFAGVGNKQYICATMATQNNSFADWAEAKNGCNNEAEVNKQTANATKDPNLKDAITANRNIIWYSLMKNGFLVGDKQLAEFFMSLSGTIIYDEKTNMQRYPSLFTTNNNLVKHILEGGTVKLYRCDKQGQNECLKPTQMDYEFKKDKTLKIKISKLLNDIVTNYKTDTPLTKAQQAFLESVTLPILKMMTVSLESGTQPNVAAYSDVISTDLIASYLQNALTVIQGSISSHGSNPDDIDKLYAVIESVNQQLRLTRMQALQTLEAEHAIIESMMQLEKRVEGYFSAETRANLQFKE